MVEGLQDIQETPGGHGWQLSGSGIGQTHHRWVLLGLVLTNMKEVKIGSSLGCHDHAQVEFMISTHMGLAKNVESGPWLSGKQTSGCLRNYWMRLSLGTKEQNRAGSTLSMPFWKYKSSPSLRIRNQADKTGKQHGWARTYCSGWGGKKRKSISSGSGEEWPGKNIELLFGCAGVESGKPRHRWNWAWWGMWKTVRRNCLDALGKTGKGECTPCDKWRSRTCLLRYVEGT